MLPIFRYLARIGHIDRDELLKTFNLGVGMILVVPAKNVSRVEADLRRRREKFFLIGRVERSSQVKPRVVYSGKLPLWPGQIFSSTKVLGYFSFALVSAAIFHTPSAPFFQTSTYSLVCVVVLPFLSVTAASTVPRSMAPDHPSAQRPRWQHGPSVASARPAASAGSRGEECCLSPQQRRWPDERRKTASSA